MKTIGTLEAKTHFSEILERVERGEEVIITRHGQPVARLGPAKTADASRRWREVFAVLRQQRVRLHPGETVRSLIEDGRKY